MKMGRQIRFPDCFSMRICFDTMMAVLVLCCYIMNLKCRLQLHSPVYGSRVLFILVVYVHIFVYALDRLQLWQFEQLAVSV